MANKIISVAMSLFLAVTMLTGCGEDKETATKKATDDATKKVQESVQKTVDTLKKTVDTLKSNVKEAVDKIDSAVTGNTPAGDVSKKSDGNMVMMETSMGKIKIKLYTDKAPITTGNLALTLPGYSE